MRSVLTVFLLFVSTLVQAQTPKASPWRAAKAAELEAVLPARAPVEQERIETEMRTATGIVNDRGQVIAAVVLITAGYAADGKYSHYLLLQTKLTLADQQLPPGAYVVGWKRAEDSLDVQIFDAGTGKPEISVRAVPITGSKRVESFHIWPPGERSVIQIGRYMLPYRVK